MNEKVSSERGEMSHLVWFLGFSCLFPSVALFHLGSSTGIQFSNLFSIAFCGLLFARGKLKLSKWFCSVWLLLCVLFIIHNIFYRNNDLLIKNFVAFHFSLIAVVAGLNLATRPHLVNEFIRGYVSASTVVSLFACVQFIGWQIFGSSSGLLLGFRNNRGFGDLDASQLVDFTAYGRAFGFSSEPSVLALLLLPSLIYLMLTRRSTRALLIALGLAATQSITVLAFVGPLVVYSLFKVKHSGKSIRLLAGVALMGTVAFLVAPHLGQLGSRLGDLAFDASSLARLNSIWSGINAVELRPLLGWGIQSDDLNAHIEGMSTIFEENKNIHSLLLSLFAWFGIPLALFIIWPVCRFIFSKNVICLAGSDVFIVATIIPAFLSLNYFNIYNIWICFGLAAGFVIFGKKQFGLVRISLH
ncbi:O-antigen ligase family protein [Pseudacidovorax intermedius]|uniref:O-antigen ligase family protein n=1 Tax=Pseudacidovorax intermedius TaxID=433924 RepID=UPI00128F12F9|nr:O-antigen ligase family protein [Pseudacidovorax intermedius]